MACGGRKETKVVWRIMGNFDDCRSNADGMIISLSKLRDSVNLVVVCSDGGNGGIYKTCVWLVEMWAIICVGCFFGGV